MERLSSKENNYMSYNFFYKQVGRKARENAYDIFSFNGFLQELEENFKTVEFLWTMQLSIKICHKSFLEQNGFI